MKKNLIILFVWPSLKNALNLSAIELKSGEPGGQKPICLQPHFCPCRNGLQMSPMATLAGGPPKSILHIFIQKKKKKN
jgi:hypothetical protein